jgi:hypothetical protein
MSKFLEILEQHDPSNQSKMDAAFQAKFFLYEQEVPFSSKGSQIILHAERGDIILEAVGMQARQVADAEEDESSYDIDSEVEKLGAKAMKGIPGWLGKHTTSAQKAKAAARKREKVAGKAVDAYMKNTKSLEDSIKNAETRTYNVH